MPRRANISRQTQSALLALLERPQEWRYGYELMERTGIASGTLYPMLVVVQSTPIVAVAPIIVVTLGAGDLPRVVITFLITFFPIVVASVTGLVAAPEELIELSRSLKAGKRREILHIRHHSLFAPRDFDLSPYFAVVKPTIERGFDYRALRWDSPAELSQRSGRA